MGFLLGIDEAGKGPVIGPLVIAGCLIEDKYGQNLSEMGIKDSKELSPKKREELYVRIKDISSDFLCLIVTPQQLNSEMDILNLNQIELARAAKIINAFSKKNPKVVIDAFEANTDRFTRKVRVLLENKGLEIISENKADKNHPVVGAASILAKVTRDREIEKLHKIYGCFGSGYPADPKTKEFLKMLDEKEFPKIVRMKWSTAQKIIESRKQKGLTHFMD
jgi:ribonuclease HII